MLKENKIRKIIQGFNLRDSMGTDEEVNMAQAEAEILKHFKELIMEDYDNAEMPHKDNGMKSCGMCRYIDGWNESRKDLLNKLEDKTNE